MPLGRSARAALSAAALVLLCATAAAAAASRAQPPDCFSFPLAYIQSAFEAGHTELQQGAPMLNNSERIAQLRVYASNRTSFKGGEVFMNTLETPQAMADIRALNAAILQVGDGGGRVARPVACKPVCST